jgi:hypothetical protein
MPLIIETLLTAMMMITTTTTTTTTMMMRRRRKIMIMNDNAQKQQKNIFIILISKCNNIFFKILVWKKCPFLCWAVSSIIEKFLVLGNNRKNRHSLFVNDILRIVVLFQNKRFHYHKNSWQIKIENYELHVARKYV